MYLIAKIAYKDLSPAAARNVLQLFQKISSLSCLKYIYMDY